MKCPKCGSEQVDCVDVMDVSDEDIDEGSVCFFACTSCGHEWVEWSE